MPGGFKPQFFPSLQGIMRLFSRPVTAASLVVHLLSINLFAARLLYLAGACVVAQPHHINPLAPWTEPGLRVCSMHAGLRDGVPTRVSVFLCAAFGPLGLLSDALTRLLLQRGATSAGHEQLTGSTQA